MASVGALAAAFVTYRVVQTGGADAPDPNLSVNRTEAEWRASLSPAAYAVLREGHTETPGSSPLVDEHRAGIFACAGCEQPLFSSTAKYDSHTGWPSFWEALPDATTRHLDFELASPRTEIRCSDCGGHLGHVFTDGPQPTGLRYCMNGVALQFNPATA